MTERVEPIDLGATWDPNGPEAVLLSRDDGTAVLALNPHPDDEDRRCVVFVWSDVHLASMSAPNDEAISGHRLYGKGLRSASWAAIVKNSDLVRQLAMVNPLHPSTTPGASTASFTTSCC